MQQHSRISITLCLGKLARHKREYVIWLAVYEVQEQAKPIYVTEIRKVYFVGEEG